jgi:hypothetical protein
LLAPYQSTTTTGFDVVRPAPARLEHKPPDLAAADIEDLGFAVGEVARLVRLFEGLVLRLVRSDIKSSAS